MMRGLANFKQETPSVKLKILPSKWTRTYRSQN